MAETRQDVIPVARKNGATPLLDSDEKLELFAEAVTAGLSTKELAHTFNCSTSTAKLYKKDPRIKALALKMIEDRVIQITRKVDTTIEQRLQNADDLDTETLLKIRKEYLGGVLRQQTTGGKADESTINAAMGELESNPNLASELQKLLTDGS